MASTSAIDSKQPARLRRGWAALAALTGCQILNCAGVGNDAAAADVLVIHAGTLLAVPGQAPQVQRTLIVRDGRIAGNRAGFLSPEEAAAAGAGRIIDLSKQFVLPGLIDLHVHLTTEAAAGETLRVVTRNAADLALLARRNARATLDAGFTTVVDLGTARLAHEQAIYALRAAIRDGIAAGPRLLVAGSPISATGSSRVGRYAPEVEDAIAPQAVCDGTDACGRAVREQIARGADLINFYNSGSLGSAELIEQAMTGAEMRAIVETAHALGRKVIADGHTAAGINAALRAGADIIDTAPWPDATSLQLLKSKGVFFEPHMYAFTVAVDEMRSGSTTVPDQADSPILARLKSVLTQPFSAQLAYQQGVRLVYGSDAGIVQHGDNAGELLQLVGIGLTPMQAIEVATVNSATAIGWRSEIGTLEAGKRADLIATDADPLHDIAALRAVSFVMRDGHVFKTP